jgi:hypothetical protein
MLAVYLCLVGLLLASELFGDRCATLELRCELSKFNLRLILPGSNIKIYLVGFALSMLQLTFLGAVFLPQDVGIVAQSAHK